MARFCWRTVFFGGEGESTRGDAGLVGAAHHSQLHRGRDRRELGAGGVSGDQGHVAEAWRASLCGNVFQEASRECFLEPPKR